MEDYRKRLFRGAKIEDCILFFEENELKAKERKNEASNDYEKGFWEGNRLAYQMAAQKLRWDFDYKTEEWEQGIIKKVEELIKQIEMMEQSSRNQTDTSISQFLKQVEPKVSSAFMDNVQEIPEEYMKGMFEGMAITYRLVISKLRSEIEAREGTEGIGNIIKDCIQDFERAAGMYKLNAEKTQDTFSKGFLEGAHAAYQVVLKQLKLEL
ncbi:hypothetical protein [Thermaerobacillus caldiproteolyticus]|uniref:hypothetical protein n=1 Tax=Thermaerobacillus caldiproteolyticus TaxID=247480 RepID=UPI00188D5CE6|nr:hypothetical protein [Anoxybacillus caldiproteolyticus]QPA32509.1 hypothetical protein ISX45_06020 [Anoxybacillus caldiproteolyticus]